MKHVVTNRSVQSDQVCLTEVQCCTEVGGGGIPYDGGVVSSDVDGVV